MRVVESFTGHIVKEINSINEGIDLILSLEKESEMYGWEKPNLDIVDSNGNSVLLKEEGK